MSTPLEGAYELTIEHRPEYLYAVLSADVMTTDIAVDYHRKIQLECEATGSSKVMLCREVPGPLDISTAFLAASDFVQSMPGVKLAIVTPYRAHDNNLDLAVRVATNRGATHKIFQNEQDAEVWLLCDD